MRTFLSFFRAVSFSAVSPSVISSSVVFFSALFLFGSGRLSAQAPADTTEQIVPGRSNSVGSEKEPYVILISADGFRHDLADKYQATNLLTLRGQGVAAGSMTPSFPSLTFPNHYAIATGLYPSHHGIVNNSFYDPAKRRGYRISDRKAVTDSSWYGGVPIWVLAEKNRLLSASFFWVGSEAAVGGIRPTYYYWFNDRIPLDSRLRQVKDWLTLPVDQRPHLILFYLSQVDHAEHLYGPESKETGEAVHVVDECIGRMTRMVDSLGLPVNFIFVSDHGMAQVDTLHPVDIPAIDTSKFVVSGGEIVKLLYAKDPKDVRPEYELLQKAADGYDAYRPENTPARWHYGKNDDRFGRAGDIVLVAKYPRMFRTRGRPLAGEHGYDNAISQMGASFYAWGPAFKKHLTVAAFENVNVYPLIAHILGLPMDTAIDGRMPVLQPILK